MSLTITLSDHTTALVHDQIRQYGTAQNVVDTAVTLLANQNLENNEKLQWLRLAIDESAKEDDLIWDPDAFEHEAMRIYEERQSKKCQK